MLEYLVKSHLGGYYITDMEKSKIEAYCETCGDRDLVLSSWSECERFSGLAHFFTKSLINSEDKLDSLVHDYRYDDLNNDEIVECIFNDITFSKIENENILNCLYEDEEITDSEFKKLSKIYKKGCIDQLNLFRSYILKKHLSKNKVNYKSLKLSNKKYTLK